MAADHSNDDAPQKGAAAVASSTRDGANTAAVCASCRRPLTRTGSGGECLRCLLGFAFSPDEESADLRPSALQSLRYGQFEIAVGPDGHPVELGAGAMAVTYRAHDTVLDSDVALKVINKNVAEHPGARARFLREARAAAKLHHPNVASVSHYGEQDGECYYAMEMVEGETLEARVRREGPLPVNLTLEIGLQVARALAAAEACGVVHRDLKPSNLMLTTRLGETGEGDSLLVKVIDWGLAKAVSAEAALGIDHTRGAFVGTPAFASPEQFTYNAAEGQRIDARADIYSLGVTLWYLLCGRTPFTGRSLEEIHSRQVSAALPVEQLTAARVPGKVVALLKTMLAVNPAARPQSARELLEALRRCQERFPARMPGITRRAGLSRRFTATALGLLLAVLAIAAAAWWYRGRWPAASAEKSIAVLPFENLSPDKADAFFTAGFKDKITANLANIAALKVINPDSVRGYPPGKRDLRAIGQALGAGQLLEGSMKREGEGIRVEVSLTDAQTAARTWTKQYDRPLAEVFALQSDITREVATRLQVLPSPAETAVINQPPTRNLAAYDLFLRGKEGIQMAENPAEVRKWAQRNIDLFTEAVKLDPGFMLAYCALAGVHDDFTHFMQGATAEERSVDHRALAEAALAQARRLQPDSGELHLVLAKHFLYINRNVEQARIELDLARRTLPNNANIERYSGQIARLEGRWEEAVRAFEKAASLDPRSPGRRNDLSITYSYLRDYENFDRAVAAMIELTPPGALAELPLYRAQGALESRADLAPLRVALAGVRDADDPGGILRDYYGIILRSFEHNHAELSRLLGASRNSRFLMADFAYPKAWFQALEARMRKDEAAAQTAFAAARVEVEKTVLADPRDERNLLLLAMIDAGLGRKDEAVREAKRACAMTPANQESLNGPSDRCCLAVVYAWIDQPDLAFAELDELVKHPAGDNMPNQPTYGDLKLNPLWDPLRSDPRFDQLVNRLAPSTPR